MRLKEDRSSWNASHIIKRDFKHDHSERVDRYYPKKNTTQWCKGRVGVIHDYEIYERFNWVYNGRIHVTYKCTNCGKKKYGSLPVHY